MEKILALLGEFKGYFTGISSALAKLTASEEQVKSLQADLSTAKQTIGTLTTQLTESKAETEKAQGEVNKLGGELKAANESLAKEKQRTTDTLAAQGIASDQLPESSTTANGGAQGETAWNKYNRLLSEGKTREAGEFYAANADAIFKSRK